MRIPSGRVVALSTKEPMVKPRLSISSWRSQLSHSRCSTWVALVAFAAEEAREGSAHDSGWQRGAGDKGLGCGVLSSNPMLQTR